MEAVYEQQSSQWFETPMTRAIISGDGKWAAFTNFGKLVRVITLSNGKENLGELSAGLDAPATAAAFCGDGTALVRGKRGAEHGWFLSGIRGLRFTRLPESASQVRCSHDATVLAYFLNGGRIFAGPDGQFTEYKVAGDITGLAFARDRKALYGVAFGADGESTLVRIAPGRPGIETVAERLDAPPFECNLAVSTDGTHVYIPLASDGAPDNEARHQPAAARWLKIYQLDAATGARRVVAESAGEDNSDPAVVEGWLYWNRNAIHQDVALVPAGGGESREIAVGQVPMWSPDGRQISYTFGGWRLADWALDLDVAAVGINAAGKRTSEPRVLISGYHEDFPAAWSPDGRWLAYHSHRSQTPVPFYNAPGSTDDIYLRRAGEALALEVRLTDFGRETGSAFWSPDGSRLLFTSWVKGGQPEIDRLWVLTLDPRTGSVLKTEKLPLPAGLRSAGWAAWSPDGSEIAIEDDREGDDKSLWVVRADGSNGQKLVDYKAATITGVDWMRDGKSIVYSALAGAGTQLFRVARSGGAPVQLTRDTGNLMHPRVSPDGRWIACTRLVQSQQIWKRPLGK
jgi:Tol biopolymer transport system component